MEIYTKLKNIQQKLVAPKGQYNSFGKYNYRSCEDILEAVKPLLRDNNAVLTISDEIIFINDRFYVKATATLTDCDSGESISNTSLAREEDKKTGMSESQVTGACSSYARKYALNGLFCIDDVKDADTRDNRKASSEEKTTSKKRTAEPANKEGLDEITARCVKEKIDMDKLLKLYRVDDLNKLTQVQCKHALDNWDKVKSKCCN